jgi:hypothetical protein
MMAIKGSFDEVEYLIKLERVEQTPSKVRTAKLKWAIIIGVISLLLYLLAGFLFESEPREAAL